MPIIWKRLGVKGELKEQRERRGKVHMGDSLQEPNWWEPVTHHPCPSCGTRKKHLDRAGSRLFHSIWLLGAWSSVKEL